MELVVLAPGVQNTTDLRFRKSGMTHSQSQFEADGTGEKRSDYAIDGIPELVLVRRQPGRDGRLRAAGGQRRGVPGPDVHLRREPRQHPGAVVNVVTKSGTNRYRGDFQYKFRSSDLDGKSVFDERAGFPKKEYSDHLYAAGVGGPDQVEQDVLLLGVRGEQLRRAPFAGRAHGAHREDAQRRLVGPVEARAAVPDLRSGDDPARPHQPGAVHPRPACPATSSRRIASTRSRRRSSYWGMPNVSGTADCRRQLPGPELRRGTRPTTP